MTQKAKGLVVLTCWVRSQVTTLAMSTIRELAGVTCVLCWKTFVSKLSHAFVCSALPRSFELV